MKKNSFAQEVKASVRMLVEWFLSTMILFNPNVQDDDSKEEEEER